MNKTVLIICMSFILIFGIGIGVYASSDIRLFVHGKQVNADIQIINGSSYVPLRTVSEALGADVKWDETNRTINIKSTKTYQVDSTVWSGSLMMKISNVTLDTAYQNSKTPNPIHAIIMDVSIENTSYSKLSWSPTKGKIQLNKNEIIEISNPISYSDDLDGKYANQDVKKGKIVVKVDSNLDDIKTIDFMIDGSTDGDTFNRVEAHPIVIK
ncbi:stalk domain-containing protein [Paenibacillus sp. SI8]|uniref:stalk domain-containing protein n=1 Tax=unclassified Paenibacillus TaxID=185978 RepID=UPI003466406E